MQEWGVFSSCHPANIEAWGTQTNADILDTIIAMINSIASDQEPMLWSWGLEAGRVSAALIFLLLTLAPFYPV